MMTKKYIKIIFSFVVIIGIWYIMASVGQSTLLPNPFAVMKKIIDNLENLKVHIIYSLMRILIALFTTFTIGILMGLVLGLYPNINSYISPLIYMSYPVPKMALLPFVMILFGFGEITKIVMIVLITVFPVVINVRDEIINIENDIFDVMTSLGASKWEVIKNIIFPSILPVILTTLRISVGISLSILFFVENYGTRYGLGYSIMDYWMRADYSGVYASIILISLLGIIMYMLIDLLETYLCDWKKKGVS